MHFIHAIVPRHVETVCLLSKHNAEQNVNIDLNMDEEELYLSNLKLLVALACLIDELKKKNYAENHYVIPAYTVSIGVLMIQRIRMFFQIKDSILHDFQ